MRRNKKAGKPIAEQPLSELQEAILEAAATNDFGIATLAEVRLHYYGEELSEAKTHSAQACISRARRGLIKRGLLEDLRGQFILTMAGWKVSDMLAREPPPPPVIATDKDLDEYDKFLIKMGKRRPTVSEILVRRSSPLRVRRVHIPV